MLRCTRDGAFRIVETQFVRSLFSPAASPDAYISFTHIRCRLAYRCIYTSGEEYYYYNIYSILTERRLYNGLTLMSIKQVLKQLFPKAKTLSRINNMLAIIRHYHIQEK